MAGMESVMHSFKDTVNESLHHGDLRFSKIETRLDFLESTSEHEDSGQPNKNPQEGNHGKTI